MNKNKDQGVPSHRTFAFGNITISSDFDSGNCSHAEKVSNTSFQLWLNGDHQKNNYRVWFYFWISGICRNTTVAFTIKNMQNQSRLVNDGLLPVYREQGSQKWEKVKISKNDSSYIEFCEGNMEWTFKHFFKSDQKHYFALFYPWSNQDNRNFLMEMSEKAKLNPDIYFYWAPISKTIEQRPIDFLVISSQKGKDYRTAKIDDKALFEGITQPATFFSSNKKCIVVSARVHPGEVPSSHVMSGIIQALIDSTQLAELIRDNFVFYLFPILNPDGVGRGHYRVDTNGINLNRCYLNPSPQSQPTIYALRSIIQHIHLQNKFFAFLDLHAHPAPRGNFFYGNSSNQMSKQIKACLFPKILSMNTTLFDYEGSNFTEQNMYAKDRGDHISKQGSGRVAMYRLTKNPQCWTLECGYHKNRFENILQPKNQTKESKDSVDEIQNLNQAAIVNYYEPKTSPFQKQFTIATYRELGHSICESFLDLANANPFSRIANPQGYFQSLNNFKMNLALSLLRESPNRFESNFTKIYYGVTKSEKGDIRINSLKALYYLLIKQAKIGNIGNFIKSGDNIEITFPSPKRRESPSKRFFLDNSETGIRNRLVKNGGSEIVDLKEKMISLQKVGYNTQYAIIDTNFNNLEAEPYPQNEEIANQQQEEKESLEQEPYKQKIEEEQKTPDQESNVSVKKQKMYGNKTNYVNYYYERVFRNSDDETFMKISLPQNSKVFGSFNESTNFVGQRVLTSDHKTGSFKNKMTIKIEEYKLSCLKQKQLKGEIKERVKQKFERIKSEKKEATPNENKRTMRGKKVSLNVQKNEECDEIETNEGDKLMNEWVSKKQINLKSGKLSSKTIFSPQKKNRSERSPSKDGKNLIRRIRKKGMDLKAIKNEKTLAVKKDLIVHSKPALKK